MHKKFNKLLSIKLNYLQNCSHKNGRICIQKSAIGDMDSDLTHGPNIPAELAHTNHEHIRDPILISKHQNQQSRPNTSINTKAEFEGINLNNYRSTRKLYMCYI
jgi:hypothetical protein